MKLQLNRVAHPVTVLGPGRRLGIWVQGCRIHCPGCASVDTWAPDGGRTVTTEDLAPELAALVVEHGLTGLTISGGEPTEQAVALADLVDRLRRALARAGDEGQPVPVLDILVFTGLAAGAAQKAAPALWAVADAAVCGPYRASRPGTQPLLASANQQLKVLTPLGRERFAEVGQTGRASLQAHVADRDITLIGLPKPGDLDSLERALLARGVRLEGHSWRTP